MTGNQYRTILIALCALVAIVCSLVLPDPVGFVAAIVFIILIAAGMQS